MAIHGAHHVTCRSSAECAVDRRALALWPGLDRRALARCRHDAARIAALVGRRSHLSPVAIRALLTAASVTPEDVATWFG